MEASAEIVRPKKKRQITEARRQQTRDAQKRYREKQKRRLEELSRLALSGPSNELSQLESSFSDIPASELVGWSDAWPADQASTSQQQSLDANRLAAHSEDVTTTYPAVSGFDDLSSDQNWSIGPSANDVDSSDLASANGSSALVVQHQTDLVFGGSQVQVSSSHVGSNSLSTVNRGSATPSSSAVSRRSWPDTWNFWQRRLAPANPIPMDTYIRLNRYSMHKAWVENAIIVGYSLKAIADCDEGQDCLQSLWCGNPHPELCSDVASGVLSEEHIKSVKEVALDLAPTANQLQEPHDLYIDCLPFPEVREKLLALRAVRPKVLDEWELKVDIHENNAMQCWGPTPWDRRSWEVQTWFLRKWWMLTGGEHGELARSSRWWRAFRGQSV